MAHRVEAPAVTVAAGVAIAAPVTTNLTWQPGKVVRIEVTVPPGPSGLMGFAIGHSGQVILPRTANQWIIADDHHFDWATDEYPEGAKWFIRAYNTDIFPHTIYPIFHLEEIGFRPRPVTFEIPIVQQDMPQMVDEP